MSSLDDVEGLGALDQDAVQNLQNACTATNSSISEHRSERHTRGPSSERLTGNTLHTVPLVTVFLSKQCHLLQMCKTDDHIELCCIAVEGTGWLCVTEL